MLGSPAPPPGRALKDVLLGDSPGDHLPEVGHRQKLINRTFDPGLGLRRFNAYASDRGYRGTHLPWLIKEIGNPETHSGEHVHVAAAAEAHDLDPARLPVDPQARVSVLVGRALGLSVGPVAPYAVEPADQTIERGAVVGAVR